MPSAPKSRLGRGLGGLISGGVRSPATPQPNRAKAVKKSAPKAAVPVAKTAVSGTNVKPDAESSPYRTIALAKIRENPYQPRREIDAARIHELAESIRSEGLIQPIVVRALAKGDYQLIAGERRYRAHQQLGLKQIQALVTEASDASSAVISLIENLQRESLNPIEEALGFASLMSDFKLTQEAVAERVGRSRASVANSLRLLQLDRELQGYIARGMLSVGHAKVLLGLEDPAQRLLLARRVLEAGMSVRETEKALLRLRHEKNLRTPARPSADAEHTVIRDLEKQIASKLNTRVTLKHSPKRGRIIIEYFGNEDLQRILEKTGLQEP